MDLESNVQKSTFKDQRSLQIIISTAVSACLDFQHAYGVPVVGFIPTGWVKSWIGWLRWVSSHSMSLARQRTQCAMLPSKNPAGGGGGGRNCGKRTAKFGHGRNGDRITIELIVDPSPVLPRPPFPSWPSCPIALSSRSEWWADWSLTLNYYLLICCTLGRVFRILLSTEIVFTDRCSV